MVHSSGPLNSLTSLWSRRIETGESAQWRSSTLLDDGAQPWDQRVGAAVASGRVYPASLPLVVRLISLDSLDPVAKTGRTTVAEPRQLRNNLSY